VTDVVAMAVPDDLGLLLGFSVLNRIGRFTSASAELIFG
jgi:hypothetical protein